MNICESCKKQHDGSYGSGRFCSISCSHSFRKSSNLAIILKKNKKYKPYRTYIHGFGPSREPSFAEKWFIQFLDTNGLKDRYRREEKIGKYWADFYFPEKRIILEVDGKAHYTKKAKYRDAIRTKFIEARGYQVYRIRWGGPRNVRVAKAFDFLEKVK